MIRIVYLLIFFIRFVSCVELSDSYLTTPQLITKYGYKPETHFITTADGYILQMHRIAWSPNAPKYKKNVVLLIHGLTSSSADFIIAGPNVGLGYYLADLGYDVWLGNCRGNRYSRNHTSISPEISKFWEFSWHEMGVYDLPASIDYILKLTNHKTLSYIGISQGVSVFFVMCSERPEYQTKIHLMQAMGPIVYMYRTKNIWLRLAGYLTNTIEFKRLQKSPYELLPNNIFFHIILNFLCSPTFINLCRAIIYEFYGMDTKFLDFRLLTILGGHFPVGASSWNFVHYCQLIEEDRFGPMDRGIQKNIAKYGQPTPPDYNLKNNSVPVMIINSLNDTIIFPDDVYRLRETLPNVVEYYEAKEYNHIDWILARNVRQTAYAKMVEVLKKYSIE